MNMTEDPTFEQLIDTPTFDQLMNEQPEDYYSSSGKRYLAHEIESMLDYQIRNSQGRSKDFFRSLERQWEEKRFLTEKQVACLEPK